MTARIEVFPCRCPTCRRPDSPTLWAWRCTGCLCESLGDESMAATADDGRAHLAACTPSDPVQTPSMPRSAKPQRPDLRTTPRRTP